jgi:hypothetical protein
VIDGSFCFLPLADLQSLYAQYLACLTAIAQGQQSYTIAGRTFTRANLDSARTVLGSIAYAIQRLNGTINNVTYADMSGGNSRSGTISSGGSGGFSPAPPAPSGPVVGTAIFGSGNPNGVTSGSPGQTYYDTSTSPYSEWLKDNNSGTGNTGWIQRSGF